DIDINSISLEIGKTEVDKAYIYLKLKLEDGKYIDNEFNLSELPKGKHTV
ncbi:hypothetical protein KI387_003407, partial [Taxus chinensis]